MCPNRLYVFGKGLNNRIYVSSALAGQAMGTWKEVEGNAVTNAALGAAALGGRIYVFAKGINDKRIYMNSDLNGQPFDGWGGGADRPGCSVDWQPARTCSGASRTATAPRPWPPRRT